MRSLRLFVRPLALCVCCLAGSSWASRFFSGSFPPYPACDANYNAACSPTNAFKAVQLAVSQLEGLATASEADSWLLALNNSQYDNGVDGFGFGPMVVSLDGIVLADPANPELSGKNLSKILTLQNDNCSQNELQTTGCARVAMTIFQENLMTQWRSALEGDGWAVWVWTGSAAVTNSKGTVVPEKMVGYIENVSTPLGDLLVVSSYSNTPLASGFATDTSCSAAYNQLCSVELSRMLVGDGLSQMMMASTPGELAWVFYDITFTDKYKAGSGFYIFVYRFGPEGSPGERGECVAHGANSGHVGQNLPEILLKVENTAVDGQALHDAFFTAAEDGGGWVNYGWRNNPTDPVGFKIAFIAGTEKFGSKYYLGVGFNHKHPTVAPGPHCTTCSMKYSYFCAIRNTYMLMGHVQAFLLTDVEQSLAWNQLTTSRNDDLALVPRYGSAEEAGYKFGDVVYDVDGTLLPNGDAFYSFVYDFNGTCVAHAANGALVGRTLWEILEFAGLNKECDGASLNCNITAVDGWQLNEDFKNAAAGGGGWVKYDWRSSASDPAFEKVAYLVKISKYDSEFYAGVGYNNLIWNPESAQNCDAEFAGPCSEDTVLAIVGQMTAAINNAQDTAELAAIFAEGTNGTGDEYRRSGGFVVEVYDESGVCMANGGSPEHVGSTLEGIFLTVGSKLLGADQYASEYQSSNGAFFTYNWQTESMDAAVERKAFAQKATYKPLGGYTEEHYYVVSSFVDAIAPPLCSSDADCPPSAECAANGRCQCQAGTIASYNASGACGTAEGCSCETQDYSMTCDVNPCPVGTFGTTSGTCQDCDPGKYADSVASSECSACAPGRYQDEYGKTACSDCSAGTAINAGGSTACDSCVEGWFQAEEGASLCEKCEYGSFSSGTMNTNCTSCPNAHETTADRAAFSQWECICQEGSYRAAGHSEADGVHQPCLPCPEGMECSQGNQEPELEKGFWADAGDSSDRDYSVYRCRDHLECPGGPSGTCASGREGVGCANCLPDHQIDKATGGCDKCAGSSVAPILLVIAVVIAGLTAMALYAKVDVSKINLNTLAVGICIGQTAVAVQALSVFRVLEVNWVEPIQSFLNVVSVLSFNLDVLAVSCIFPDSNAFGKYVLKVFIFPTGIALLCAIFFIMNRFFKQSITQDHIINSIGLLFLVLFLTLAMLSLSPFHCAKSPNGTASLVSNPAVLCSNNATWNGLAVFGALAILGFVVFFTAWVTYVTLQYPKLISAGNGMLIINRYRFLFQRFTVECYFFTPIYLARNFTIAILPVIFADYGHRQVFLLACVLMVFGFLQGWLKPWRGLLPNLLDTITTACLIMALLGAALLHDVEYDAVVSDMQVFFTILIVVMCITIFVFVGFMAWRRSFPPKLYAAFLCHHKLGCAVGARLMKMELEQRLKKPVFLDSDALNNLEDLLETVRTSIGNLVVLLTAGTLSRPWCAGEIATAFKNGVPIVPVTYDDYTELTEEDVKEASIGARWSPEAFGPCVAQGVLLSAVADAYDYVRRMEKIVCPRVAACLNGEPAAAMDAVRTVVAYCRSKPKPKAQLSLGPLGRTSLTSDGTDTSETGQLGGRHDDDAADAAKMAMTSTTTEVGMTPRVSQNSQLDFAVLANYTCGESISAARVLARLVRGKTQMRTTELLHPRDVQDARSQSPSLGCLCVLLTQGCLASEGFPKTLMAALEAWDKAHPTILTVTMTGFAFPSSDVMRSSIVPQMAKTISETEDKISNTYQKLFSILACPFSPSGHISVLEVEVDGIVRRMRSDTNRKTNARSSLTEDPDRTDDSPPKCTDADMLTDQHPSAEDNGVADNNAGEHLGANDNNSMSSV